MSYEISFTNADFELRHGGKACVSCRFSRPVFAGPGARRLNLYCSRFFAVLKCFCQKRLLPLAAEAPQSGRGPVAVRAGCAVMSNDEGCLSLCFDVSLGKGPPRRYASNWDPETGFPLSARRIAGAGRGALAARVAEQIDGRSGPGRSIYYKDYKRLIKRRLSLDNLFVRDGRAYIFFQPGELAPPLEGLQLFPLGPARRGASNRGKKAAEKSFLNGVLHIVKRPPG